MATRKLPPKKEALLIRSYALTSVADAALKRISEDATDVIGRAVSESAVIRAMLRYMNRYPFPWVRENLYPCIEEEMERGTTWGKTKS
jgi:hypothetical protein